MTTIRAGIATLMRELGWSVPGHGAAMDAVLLTILVETLRALGAMQGGARSLQQFVGGGGGLFDRLFRPGLFHALLYPPCGRIAARLSPNRQ